jgi:hypothetical protein
MSTKGMVYPQEKPMLAGNPKDSAIAANNQSASRQADLIKATSGGKRYRRYKRNKHGGADNGGVVVPQFQMQYSTTGAGGQDPNSIIKQNASVSTQGAENAKYDNLARVGGSRKRRGGNPDWSWGCYSGGRKKSRSRRSKSYKRKTHKKRRTNRRK